MKTKEFFKDAPMIYIIVALASLTGYFLRLTLTKNLSVVDYGLFYSAFAFIAFFGVFKTLGLQEAQIFFINKFRNKLDYVKTVFFTTLIIQVIASLIIACVIMLFSNFLAQNYFKDSDAYALLIVLCVVFVLDTFLLHFLNFFVANQKIKYLNIGDFLRTLFIFIFVIIFFKVFSSDVFYVGLAYLAGYVMVNIVYIIMMSRQFKNIFSTRMHINKKLTKTLVIYSIPVMLGMAGTILLTSTDTFMLTYFTGLEAVGLYNVALPIVAILSMFSSPISAIVFPKISNLFHRKKSKDISEILGIIYNNYLIIALPLSLSLFFYSDAAIILLFDAKYLGASMVLKIFSAFFVFMSLKDINFAIISGMGKPKENSKIIYFAAGFNFIANLILIPLFGIVGAASATVASFVLMFILSIRVIKKEYNLYFNYVKQLKIIFSSLLFLLIIFMLQQVILVSNTYIKAIIILGISFIMYLGILFAVRVLTKNEVDAVKKLIFK